MDVNKIFRCFANNRTMTAAAMDVVSLALTMEPTLLRRISVSMRAEGGGEQSGKAGGEETRKGGGSQKPFKEDIHCQNSDEFGIFASLFNKNHIFRTVKLVNYRHFYTKIFL
jgi:hypothetical protein